MQPVLYQKVLLAYFEPYIHNYDFDTTTQVAPFVFVRSNSLLSSCYFDSFMRNYDFDSCNRLKHVHFLFSFIDLQPLLKL